MTEREGNPNSLDLNPNKKEVVFFILLLRIV